MATTTPDPLALPGIRPDIAAARGYRVLDAEEAASELPALGFADYQAALGPGLLVPMFDVRSGSGPPSATSVTAAGKAIPAR